MTKPVKFQEMLASLRRSLEAVPQHRTGRNVRYGLVDAGLGAFSVFFLQSPSLMGKPVGLFGLTGSSPVGFPS